jgi:hypothetical protein
MLHAACCTLYVACGMRLAACTAAGPLHVPCASPVAYASPRDGLRSSNGPGWHTRAMDEVRSIPLGSPLAARTPEPGSVATTMLPRRHPQMGVSTPPYQSKVATPPCGGLTALCGGADAPIWGCRVGLACQVFCGLWFDAGGRHPIWGCRECSGLSRVHKGCQWVSTHLYGVWTPQFGVVGGVGGAEGLGGVGLSKSAVIFTKTPLARDAEFL